MANFRELKVYQKLYRLAVDIDIFTRKLSRAIQFDLADQIRRASKSIPTNIVEGYARNKSKKDIANFLKNALGSNDECLVHLDFLKDLKHIKENQYLEYRSRFEEVGKMLYGLHKTLLTSN